VPLQERIASKLKIPLPLVVTLRSLPSLTSLLRMICGLTLVSFVCKCCYVLCRLSTCHWLHSCHSYHRCNPIRAHLACGFLPALNLSRSWSPLPVPGLDFKVLMSTKCSKDWTRTLFLYVSHCMVTNRLMLNADKTELTNTVLLFLLAVDCYLCSEMRPSQLVIECASSVSPSRLTSASTSM